MQKLRDKKGFICDMDIIAGIESEIETALVLSGITKRADLELFPYQPDYVLNCVADIIRGA